mmetsp:Transcript_10213/g.15274  ORF Transcript_10213/g.15274 Transcript_10213/m.15274 type:complete len:472 (-) Transcript_10213:116-1531(-)|eukprot:CAMPEP_0167741022 /NCGR_PEP_ID=MMETSP0110_2-20121227/624_1 /TAXON_ID=629695 /ORGANISM="Gymnochlora sp., Strain CCMP2014" /LENGTH=471 /DNA_ID=CAMNT_0007625025 /DNA_START=40 /DNA_END=1455 /DNA_ORIENTATION=+
MATRRRALVAAICSLSVLSMLFSRGGNASLSRKIASRKALTGRVSQSSIFAPPAPLRSTVARSYCEEVVDPLANMHYETMSYMPDFNERDMENQVNYMIQNGFIPCVEFDKTGKTFRENSRMPNYYDGRYWTLWKLPMFGATNAYEVMHEVSECKRQNPDSYIRILGFDNMRQVQCMGFLASKPSENINRASFSPVATSLSRPVSSRAQVLGSNAQAPDFALLFDCDGVIVLTEELHRIAYNKAFEKYNVQIDGSPVTWPVEYYDILQNTIGGGKPKMKYHFNNNGWPTSSEGGVPLTEEEQTALVDKLQDAKTVYFKELVGQVATARPGVLELMDEAIADPNIAVGICSAQSKEGFVKVVDAVVGQDRLSKLDVVMAGDDVTRKKPDPLIYNLAKEKLGIDNSKCVVVEDSIIGLKAAKGAGMKCIITYTGSTKNQPFFEEGANAVIEDLGGVRLSNIFGPLYRGQPLSL